MEKEHGTQLWGKSRNGRGWNVAGKISDMILLYCRVRTQPTMVRPRPVFLRFYPAFFLQLADKEHTSSPQQCALSSRTPSHRKQTGGSPRQAATEVE